MHKTLYMKIILCYKLLKMDNIHTLYTMWQFYMLVIYLKVADSLTDRCHMSLIQVGFWSKIYNLEYQNQKWICELIQRDIALKLSKNVQHRLVYKIIALKYVNSQVYYNKLTNKSELIKYIILAIHRTWYIKIILCYKLLKMDNIHTLYTMWQFYRLVIYLKVTDWQPDGQMSCHWSKLVSEAKYII